MNDTLVGFKPMLAGTVRDLSTLRFPMLATPKLDGIRCVTPRGEALSRSLKPIPNQYIAATLRGAARLDGELTVGDTFQSSTSGVMSEDGEPDFTYTVFDYISEGVPYETRMEILKTCEKVYGGPRLKFLYPEKVPTLEALEAIAARHLEQGYEGTMLRTPDGPYKFGRSTEREGWLLKLKPMEDEEAVVIGFEEQLHNTNAATRNALGRLERSSHKAGKVGKDTLGKLLLASKKWGEFAVGTGFDDALRAKIWANQKAYLGKTVKFKYQNFGIKDKPRLPVFLGFRDARDL